MSLFGNNGKLTFTVSEDDKKALKKGLGKDFVMNDQFLACVQHFKGAGLIHTLSMNACVVACIKDTPTGDAIDDHHNKNGMLRCMSAVVQQKGWESKNPKKTNKRKRKPKKVKKGEKPDDEVEFQLLFVEDIKEHLDNIKFEDRCKNFCKRSSELTQGRLTLKSLQLKTVKQCLGAFIQVMHWVNDGKALHEKVNLDGFKVDEINKLFNDTVNFIEKMAKQDNVNTGLRNLFADGVENGLDNMFRQFRNETSEGTKNLKMILGIPKEVKEQESNAQKERCWEITKTLMDNSPKNSSVELFTVTLSRAKKHHVPISRNGTNTSTKTTCKLSHLLEDWTREIWLRRNVHEMIGTSKLSSVVVDCKWKNATKQKTKKPKRLGKSTPRVLFQKGAAWAEQISHAFQKR